MCNAHTHSYITSAREISANVLRNLSVQGPVSRKSRNLFGPEKPFVKLRPVYSVKLLFSYVEKGIKMKTTAKFRASRRLRFADTKRVMSPEMSPKSFGTFEKQAPELKISDLSQICIILSLSVGNWGYHGHTESNQSTRIRYLFHFYCIHVYIGSWKFKTLRYIYKN